MRIGSIRKASFPVKNMLNCNKIMEEETCFVSITSKFANVLLKKKNLQENQASSTVTWQYCISEDLRV